MLCLIKVSDINADFELLFCTGPLAPDGLKSNFVQGNLLCTPIICE